MHMASHILKNKNDLFIPRKITFLFLWVCKIISPVSLVSSILFKKTDFIYDRTRMLKGTVSVISSDPPCKNVNVRLTTVPLIPLYVKIMPLL